MRLPNFFIVIAGVLLFPGYLEAQGTFDAIGFTPTILVNGTTNGVGWSFVPTSDLRVTAISSTAPQVSFWRGTNEVIVAFSYIVPPPPQGVHAGPTTDFQTVPSLLLSAGQTYSISTSHGTPETFFWVFSHGEGPSFTTSPYITEFGSYFVSSSGQWSSTTTPASLNTNYLFLGPNFQFQVIPEPSSLALFGLTAGAWCLVKVASFNSRRIRGN